MITIEAFKGNSVQEQQVEIVERKGKGHPDFICDAAMDAVSVALSQEYIRQFGRILHHNIDKSLLAAGSVEKRFGGGRVIRPMELIIGDRATFSVGDRQIPVTEIALGAAREWFRKNLRFVDPELHVNFRVVLAPGSEELTDIFARPGEVMAANDTSAAVGYWPLSPTELAVLALEQHLNSREFKEHFPETGEDIKVMGLRSGKDLELTVAMPFLARFIESEGEYFARKGVVEREIGEFLTGLPGFGRKGVRLNALDEPGRGLGGVYLSLLGTSAEDADSGQVGRGNRVNGIIALGRPLGTEAAAGKNPVSHVGKIYNILAHRLAQEICEELEGVREAHVLLLSRIGTPIDRPRMAAAQLLLEKGIRLGNVSAKAEEIIGQRLAGINGFCMELAAGRYPVC
ncbi:Methionine adenosyltransferase [Geobacter metallireducens RCH3]|uniref:ATP--methionine S-adenosyltransferase n=1 Tax=Geobacter metallireducens (strain ATCC 53774 / DSM 7210 / GS-15) TaxID=269799 RepID=Q39SK6_GEOMG|nr:methionine adenosyltransferase [Geobacter metallireducens]ABB32768.1 ATP--methionine S-adenosyltransferase [Geobacter metallireducens GS-15]EHP86122.1 Methionine adenosyltransferase [Geobacter metallireducens RCH3]